MLVVGWFWAQVRTESGWIMPAGLKQVVSGGMKGHERGSHGLIKETIPSLYPQDACIDQTELETCENNWEGALKNMLKGEVLVAEWAQVRTESQWSKPAGFKQVVSGGTKGHERQSQGQSNEMIPSLYPQDACMDQTELETCENNWEKGTLKNIPKGEVLVAEWAQVRTKSRWSKPAGFKQVVSGGTKGHKRRSQRQSNEMIPRLYSQGASTGFAWSFFSSEVATGASVVPFSFFAHAIRGRSGGGSRNSVDTRLIVFDSCRVQTEIATCEIRKSGSTEEHTEVCNLVTK